MERLKICHIFGIQELFMYVDWPTSGFIWNSEGKKVQHRAKKCSSSTLSFNIFYKNLILDETTLLDRPHVCNFFILFLWRIILSLMTKTTLDYIWGFEAFYNLPSKPLLCIFLFHKWQNLWSNVVHSMILKLAKDWAKFLFL